ncbi:uncharacterized protein LOC131235399 [Magnolia sinica]|uniref:uncharacterized protein LOC131235399 n=1 Tax=Magnolia sinica TaxID=86752 RepID=UPI00265AF129|nr:uncharacterized protein LOC131235399 [Magnolia sinica]
MEKLLRLLSVSLLLFLTLPNATVNGIRNEELEDMISALQSKAYNLFGNAVMTSELQYDILSGHSFTFFVPTDSALFALDMRSSASHYIQTLRCHVTLRRLPTSSLASLSPCLSFLPTLHPRRTVFISRRPSLSPGSDILTVNGVDIIFPGLFYGRNIAVHGLDGILTTRLPVGIRHSPVPANQRSRPRMQDQFRKHVGIAASPEIQYPSVGITPESHDPLSSRGSGLQESVSSAAMPPELQSLSQTGHPSEIPSPTSLMWPELGVKDSGNGYNDDVLEPAGFDGWDMTNWTLQREGCPAYGAEIPTRATVMPLQGDNEVRLDAETECGERREGGQGLRHVGIQRGRPRQRQDGSIDDHF